MPTPRARAAPDRDAVDSARAVQRVVHAPLSGARRRAERVCGPPSSQPGRMFPTLPRARRSVCVSPRWTPSTRTGVILASRMGLVPAELATATTPAVYGRGEQGNEKRWAERAHAGHANPTPGAPPPPRRFGGLLSRETRHLSASPQLNGFEGFVEVPEEAAPQRSFRLPIGRPQRCSSRSGAARPPLGVPDQLQDNPVAAAVLPVDPHGMASPILQDPHVLPDHGLSPFGTGRLPASSRGRLRTYPRCKAPRHRRCPSH